jgi:uncharacterized phage protein (TIGR01671 family)
MIKIKFRGLDIRTKAFVFGCYVTDNKDYHAIVRENPNDSSEMLNTLVDLKSVGQFTGLQDKNDVDIYQGDILFHSMQGARAVLYPMSKDVACFGIASIDGKKNTLQDADKLYTVIGNIHETPELLEVNNEN